MGWMVCVQISISMDGGATGGRSDHLSSDVAHFGGADEICCTSENIRRNDVATYSLLLTCGSLIHSLYIFLCFNACFMLVAYLDLKHFMTLSDTYFKHA